MQPEAAQYGNLRACLLYTSDLGRVVVPKEIRRTLRIREGDPLEIFTDREGEIILKKYSPDVRLPVKVTLHIPRQTVPVLRSVSMQSHFHRQPDIWCVLPIKTM